MQNASFTLVSRARNSSSLMYHAVAALASNAVYFAALFATVGRITEALRSAPAPALVALGAWYSLCTLAGSLSAHWALMRWVERRHPDTRGR